MATSQHAFSSRRQALWNSYPSEYIPFIAPTDQPAIWLNEEIMAKWRPLMREFYYDPDRFDNYLEQLGIEYPTVKPKTVSDR